MCNCVDSCVDMSFLFVGHQQDGGPLCGVDVL